jgi:hypothetical protein
VSGPQFPETGITWLSPWRCEPNTPVDEREHEELVSRGRAALADVPWLRDLLAQLDVVVYVDSKQFGVFLPAPPESPEAQRLVMLPPVCRALEIAAAGCVWSVG